MSLIIKDVEKLIEELKDNVVRYGSMSCVEWRTILQIIKENSEENKL